MTKKHDKKLILQSGEQFYGCSFGADRDAVLELVFNTSMAGYQEILSDPSYTYQAVVMTYPLIGNYGMADDDYETDIPTVGAFIVREYNDEPSNFRSTETLGSVMKRYGIPGISDVDNRKLTRSIRDKGSRRVLITSADTPLEKGLEIIEKTPVPKDAVPLVSCKEIYTSGGEDLPYHVVAIDCGMKKNIVRSLNKKGCRVTVVPWNTESDKIESLGPDGVFISNGPGDPQDVPETIKTVKNLIGKYPIFGICLGHQILSLAYGGNTYKLKFGHRGGNHPVKNIETERIDITSQNHSFSVDTKSLENTPLKVTHINLLDGTVEGVECAADRAYSVQYHPESAPGPQDSFYLFDKFIGYMRGSAENA